MSGSYVPNIGDIVWLEFDPQAGREQAGHRPALVLSPKVYNSKTSLMICVPITSQIKGYPFEVLINTKQVKGAALVDQVKSLDWRIRDAKKVAKAQHGVVDQVKQLLNALLSIDE